LELADDRRYDRLFKNSFSLISKALDFAVSIKPAAA
jgi:hypothetical protein